MRAMNCYLATENCEPAEIDNKQVEHLSCNGSENLWIVKLEDDEIIDTKRNFTV